MSCFLKAISIQNFRSFGSEVQEIGPFSKVNVFIGPNNTGKSNILSAIKCLHFLRNGERFKYNKNDCHKKQLPWPELGYGLTEEDFNIPNAGPETKRCLNLFRENWPNRLRCLPLRIPNSRGELVGNKSAPPSEQLITALSNIEKVDWDNVRKEVVRNEISRETIAEIVLLNTLRKTGRMPPVRRLSAARLLRAAESQGDLDKQTEHTGAGVYQEINSWQGLTSDKEHLVSRAERFREFFRELTEQPDAELTVPNDYKEITANMEGLRLPLEAKGTGYHQLVTIGTFTSRFPNQILLLEEPELHLHPRLQRKLLNLLLRTSNQYFITTHSACFLDHPEVALFGVRLTEGQTKVTPLLDSQEKWSIIDTLGYRPSDIAQANCVIWVEGPSDRIYLKSWLKAKAEDLVEGVHFAIMWYGGANLAHLGDPEPEENELVDLLTLNQYSAVICDSDKGKKDDKLKKRVQNIKSALEIKGRFVWITEGREVENYIPLASFEKAVNEVHSDSDWVKSNDQRFGSFTKRLRKDGRETSVSKIPIAREIIGYDDVWDWTLLDLEDKLKKLIQYIRLANR